MKFCEFVAMTKAEQAVFAVFRNKIHRAVKFFTLILYLAIATVYGGFFWLACLHTSTPFALAFWVVLYPVYFFYVIYGKLFL